MVTIQTFYQAHKIEIEEHDASQAIEQLEQIKRAIDEQNKEREDYD